MSNFFAELKRRNVFRVGIAYAVVGWLLVQITAYAVPAFSMPPWVNTVVFYFVLIGFPVALLFAWAFELTPEGLKKTREIKKHHSISADTGKKINKFITSALVLAIAFIVYDKFISTPEPVVIEAQAAATSIAVLPFVNMSDDASNEYFSDGISEELLNLLAKIPELRVTSRSTAFSYKGKDVDTPTIAEQLNIAHVLQGSVRKDGNRVRITVQLIEARSDTHIWSETYDRTLDDIFATQDDIAARVVEQLKVTLLGDVPTIQTTAPEAYALVLQARYLGRQYTSETLEKSIALLEAALAIDPEYAPAWAGLARVYHNQTVRDLRRTFDEGFTLSREAANQALALDPENASAHESLGRIAREYDRDFVAAGRHYQRALTLDPANTDTLIGAARILAYLDRLDQAIAVAEYAVARDPVNPFSLTRLGIFYLNSGRLDEAIASFRTTLTLSPDYIGAQYWIGYALLLKGEPEAALAAMQKEGFEMFRLFGLVKAHHALGNAAASDAALAELIEKYEKGEAYNIAYLLAYRGEADRTFAWLAKAVTYKDAGLAGTTTEPLFANIHDDPRWLPFLESISMSPADLAAIEFEVTLPE